MTISKTLTSSVVLAGICLAALTSTSASAQVRIQNQYRTDQQINIETGTPISSPTQPGWLSAQWQIEPVPGEKFVRIRNVWKGTYLNNEKGVLESTAIQPGWWSAQWTLTEMVGGGYRICNRWTSACLHTENQRLELGNAPINWVSAVWNLNGYSSQQLAAPAPTPTPRSDPFATRARTSDDFGTTRKSTALCGSERTCWVHFRGVLAKKRTEISDDEVFATVNMGPTDSNPLRFPKPYFDKSRLFYPVVVMNENNSYYRQWQICEQVKLDKPVNFSLIESDKNSVFSLDNSSPDGDDIIASFTVDNSGGAISAARDFQVAGGGIYTVFYEVSAAREDFKPCLASGPRDPDQNTIDAADKRVELHKICSDWTDKVSSNVDTGTEAGAIVAFGTYGACMANGGPY